MSGYAGELFVRIVPDAQGFDQELTRQVGQQAKQAQQSPGSNQNVAALQRSQQQALKTLQETAKAAEIASAQFLVGAGSEDKAAAAAEAYAFAGRAAAKANVELALATGQAVQASDLQILSLKRSDQALQEHGRHAQRFRQQARLVAEGEAPLSSLLGGGALLKFGAGAFAVGAVISTLGTLEESLKATGDEAFTTEGRLKNLAGAALTGNLVEAFKAINDEAPTVSERLKVLLADSSTTSVDLANLGSRSQKAAQDLQTLAAAQQKVGEGGAFAKAIRDAAEETKNAASEALALARAYETAAQAAQDVADNIAVAGSESARFGESVRGAGAVARSNAQQFGPPNRTDSSATSATANAVKESIAARKQGIAGLRAQLAVAQQEEAQARALEKNQAQIREGAAERYRAVVEATTKVSQIEAQIAAAEKKAAEDAARSRKQATDEAKSAYAQQVANTATELRIAADAAGNRGAKEKKLLEYLQRESRDSRLAREEQLRYAAELTNERQKQRAAVVSAAKADIDYRRSLLELNIQRAETLTPNNTKDDVRAYRQAIAYYTRLRDQAKKLGKAGREAVVEYESQIIGLKGKILGAKSGSTGFSASALFDEAVRQFQAYGSNIAGKNGILSGQDARAALGQQIGMDFAGQIQAAQLAQQQQQTTYLARIADLLAHSSPAGGSDVSRKTKGSVGSLQGLAAVQAAGVFGY